MRFLRLTWTRIRIELAEKLATKLVEVPLRCKSLCVLFSARHWVWLLFSFQYVYLKQMTKAAVVIQNQFRSYYEHKRFKKNLEAPPTPSSTTMPSGVSNTAAGLASAAAAGAVNYRNYRDNSINNSGRQSREGTPTSSALKWVWYSTSLNRLHPPVLTLSESYHSNETSLFSMDFFLDLQTLRVLV